MTQEITKISVLNPQTESKTAERRHDLDLLRGMALLVMVIGHNVRIGWTATSYAQLILATFGELFSALFMLVSGMNVLNFYYKAILIPGFKSTRFYVKSAIYLFFLGYTYNIIVGTFGSMDIIQSMALGILTVYLLLIAKTPNWLVGVITAMFFVTGILAFGNGMILNPEVKSNFFFHYLISDGEITPESVRGMIPGRYLFMLFGPIPWIGYFTLGLFLERLKKWPRIAIGLLCLGLAVAAVFLPMIDGETRTVIGFKTNTRYIFQTTGLFGLWFLLFKLVYKGKNRFGRFLEGWGVLSLIILMFHWFYIMIYSMIAAPIAIVLTGGLGSPNVYRWIRAFFVFVTVLFTVKPIAAIQAKWMKHPKFEFRAKVFLIGGFVLFLLGLRLASAGISRGRFFAFVGSYMAAWSFTFLYPYLRTKWRKECMPA